MFRFATLVILIFNVLHFSIYARFASHDDFNYEVVFGISDYNVNKDGTYTETIEKQFLILREDGKNFFSNFKIFYTEGVEEVEIIEAYSSFKGKKTFVDKSKIEDKPLASRGHGFDQTRQIYIPFNNINLGGEIYIKRRTKVVKPVMTGFFSAIYSCNGDFIRKAKVTVNSEIPLYLKKNDVENVLKITSSNDNKKHTIELKKPFSDLYVEEGGATFLPWNKRTYCCVSTENNWTNLKKYFSSYYNKIINDDFPKKLDFLVDKLSKKNINSIDLLNTITSYVQEHYQYFGNWTTIEGRLIPRKLTVIADSSIGDCKDFASLVAATVNKIDGYRAYVALIHRGELHDLSYYDHALPSVDAFNHAIVYVIDPHGKKYWIDPTNKVSMAGKIFSDISNRQALILNNDFTEELVYTTATKPSDSIQNFFAEVSIQNSHDVYYKYEATFDGLVAKYITEHMLSMSKQAINNALYQFVIGNIKLEDRKSIKISDFSRIVNKVQVNLEAIERQAIGISNLGNTFVANITTNLPVSREDKVATYYSDPPNIINKKLIIKDISVANIEKLNVSYKTPWFEYSRQCRAVGNDFEIVTSEKLLKSFISAEEIKSDAYRALEAFLMQNSKITIVFNRK